MPSKCVFTLKPPTKPGQRCRRKCRLVICGNYIAKGEAGDQMDLYASGTSTEVLRLALTLAASRQWLAAIADVTSAFLLAEWPPHMPKYGLTPPRGRQGQWALRVRYMGGSEAALWSEREPSDLGRLQECQAAWNQDYYSARRKLGLSPLVSESEVWLLKDEINGDLYGILVVYVDDLTCLAEEGVIRELHKEITSLWPTSDLEWAGPEKAVRYLGVEIKYKSDSSAYTISQQAYITELLRVHNLQDAQHTQLPVPREWLEEAEREEETVLEFSDEDLRAGQKAVGVALWLAASYEDPSGYSLCGELNGGQCFKEAVASYMHG